MSSDPSLMGRVVVITGGSRGLGREMAVALAESGARVAITARTCGVEMQDALAALKEAGGHDCALAVAADVRDFRDCERVVEATKKAFGAIHVLFNNAGLGLQAINDISGKAGARFWETSNEAWEALVDTNVNGVFNMAKAVTPTMIAQGFGKIINLSTNRHTMLRLGGSSYGGAKAFLELASRVWARELDGTGVTVNVLLPGGAVDTGIRKDPLPDGIRFHPAAIMRAPTRWLASDLSNGCTGGRFLARLWNERLPLAERVAAARDDGAELPQIM